MSMEEVEIKIEYHDTCEQDPLCDNLSSHKDVTNFEVDEGSSEAENVIAKESQSLFKEVKESVKIEDSPIKNEQWYKSVDSSGRYLCKFCELPYLTVQTVRRHTLTKHPAEAKILREAISKNNRSLNKCHICKQKFSHLENLKQHLQTHHTISNSNFCHKCKAMFDNEDTLCNHLRTIHKLVGSSIYVCLACGYKTCKVSHFKQHQKVHLITTHKCNYCNYSTNHMYNLKTHLSVHEKCKRSFKCKIKGCCYSATTQSALQTHKLTHSKEEHFKYCDKCTYKTIYKQSLRKHIDSHLRNTVKIM